MPLYLFLSYLPRGITIAKCCVEDGDGCLGKDEKLRFGGKNLTKRRKERNIIRGMIRLKNASYKTQQQQNCAPSVLVREKKGCECGGI